MHRLATLGLGLVLALSSVSCGASSGDPSADNVPVPAEGAYFGTHFSAGLADRRDRIEQLEADLGRPLLIDHVYHRWDDEFPSDYDRWTMDQGRILFLNWTTRTDSGPPVKFRDIISGALDDVIDARARAIADLGRPVLLGFGHEPGALIGEGGSRSGTEEEYVEAWRHVASRFDAAGARNVSWVWTLTAFAFKNGDGEGLYPGDDVVDWVGVDGYVNVGCPWLNVPWSPWSELFAPADAFAAAHDKPLVVAEFGLGEDPGDPQRKAEWLRDAAEEIQEMESLKAVVSFNSQADCSSHIVTSEAALRGYRAMAQDPWLMAGVRREGQ